MKIGQISAEIQALLKKNIVMVTENSSNPIVKKRQNLTLKTTLAKKPAKIWVFICMKNRTVIFEWSRDKNIKEIYEQVGRGLP